MASPVQHPLVLEPKFQKKPRRRFENGFGVPTECPRLGAVSGTLDPAEDVVVVEDATAILALDGPGKCFGQIFPVPFARRVKGKMHITEGPVPTASEFKAQCKLKLAADKAKVREQCGEPVPSSPSFQKEADPDEPPKLVKLSLVEALYLAYELERLTIFIDSSSKDIFETDDFFMYCCGSAGGVEFASRYIAYRYYRSKGWVVRDGETYGVTYVLYKSHPAEYHSTFGVLVVTQPPKPLNWRKMGGLCRALGVVSKGLIICTITSDCEDTSELTISDLDRFQISEMHVKPWFARHHPQQRLELEGGTSKDTGKR